MLKREIHMKQHDEIKKLEKKKVRNNIQKKIVQQHVEENLDEIPDIYKIPVERHKITDSNINTIKQDSYKSEYDADKQIELENKKTEPQKIDPFLQSLIDKKYIKNFEPYTRDKKSLPKKGNITIGELNKLTNYFYGRYNSI